MNNEIKWKEYKNFLDEELIKAERIYFEAKIKYETIKNQVESIDVRECPICGEYYNKIKRQEYCSNACKTKAYRIRKSAENEINKITE